MEKERKMSKDNKQKEKYRRKWEEAIDRIFDSAISDKTKNKNPLHDSPQENTSCNYQFVDCVPELKITQILDVKKPKRSSQLKKSLGYSDFI